MRRGCATCCPAPIVFGLGLVTFVAPLTATVMGSVDADQVSTASGVNNAIARTASLGAIAVIPAASGLTTASGPEEVADAVRTALVTAAVLAADRRPAVLRRAGGTRAVALFGPPSALRRGRTAAATRSDALPRGTMTEYGSPSAATGRIRHSAMKSPIEFEAILAT